MVALPTSFNIHIVRHAGMEAEFYAVDFDLLNSDGTSNVIPITGTPPTYTMTVPHGPFTATVTARTPTSSSFNRCTITATTTDTAAIAVGNYPFTVTALIQHGVDAGLTVTIGQGTLFVRNSIADYPNRNVGHCTTPADMAFCDDATDWQLIIPSTAAHPTCNGRWSMRIPPGIVRGNEPWTAEATTRVFTPTEVGARFIIEGYVDKPGGCDCDLQLRVGGVAIGTGTLTDPTHWRIDAAGTYRDNSGVSTGSYTNIDGETPLDAFNYTYGTCGQGLPSPRGNVVTMTLIRPDAEGPLELWGKMTAPGKARFSHWVLEPAPDV